ncbi:MAG TPA: SxtJ family membrane protein [Pirellulales bacterium]|jgi:hypothetical protein|nr:SxtJ family membrane protein [Pirellulales bacterium]
MALIEINRNPTTREIRQFALLWLPAFCFLAAGWLGYRLAWPAAAGLVACGLVSAVVGVFRPRWMRIVLMGWMWAAFPIGWTVSHLLMASIYYLVVTPIGWLMRLAGRDPLARKFDHTADTYWTPRAKEVDPARYFRQF